MDKPTKLFLGGVICAAIIAAVGFANTHRLETKVRNLEAECVEEGKREDKVEPREKGWKAACDAEDLAEIERQSGPILKGVAGRVLAAKREALASEGQLFTRRRRSFGFFWCAVDLVFSVAQDSRTTRCH